MRSKIYNPEIGGGGPQQTHLGSAGKGAGWLSKLMVDIFFNYCLNWDFLTSVGLLGLGLVIHLWTVVLALEYMGAESAGIALITPIISEISYYSRMLDHTGTVLNPYCVTIIIWIWCVVISRISGVIWQIVFAVRIFGSYGNSYPRKRIKAPENMTKPVGGIFSIERSIFEGLKEQSKIEGISISELGDRIITEAAEKSDIRHSTSETRNLNPPTIYSPFYVEDKTFKLLLDWQKKTGQTRSGLVNQALQDYLRQGDQQ